MRFRSVLSVLSKSSPYAVRTLNQHGNEIEDAVKKYLFIETDIERAFKERLIASSSGDIIFLCGSSGDGKSEILTKYCSMNMFKEKCDFHLDATHSFSPQSTAIQTLDELFDRFYISDKVLVVGINVGMLGNYAEEGDERHAAIKGSIHDFLSNKSTPSNRVFLDFEKFPKFKLQKNGYAADFVKELLKRITANNDSVIRQQFNLESALTSAKDDILCANYELLSIDEVQNSIIQLLFKARLFKDQFLTARALLDFIFHLLAGPGYLFDNLFTSHDNELASKIVDFDPSNIRTKQIDRFILARALSLPDHDFDIFIRSLTHQGINRLRGEAGAESYLRLFYLLRTASFSNDYHHKFREDFAESVIDIYADIWHLHNDLNDSTEQLNNLRKFYKDTVIAAIHKYNNRNSPKLNKGEFFVSEHNGYQVAAEVDIKVDMQAIAKASSQNTSFFNAYFKVGTKTISLSVNVNLLELMYRILEGYRPNKHDKNTVMLLDELIDEIIDSASKSDKLTIINGNSRYKIVNDEFDTFEVSGL